MPARARPALVASRLAAAVAAGVLVTIATAYYFTYEPAFELTIRWREGVTWDRRLALEREFGLVRSRNQERRTLTYDLVDTRRDNVRAILEQPEIEDGGVLDRRTSSVPPDAPYGQGWMWVGSRWPALRTNRLVPPLAAVASVTLLFWARQELRARHVGALRLVACLGWLFRARVQHAGERLPERRGIGP